MVSVIIPVHNAEKFIIKTVKSVEVQSYSEWEIIMVDDHSSDGSVEIIRKHIAESKNRISLIMLDEETGAAAARNAGIRAAIGRYIAFLDADDIWLPKKLEKTISFINENNAGFAFTAYEFGDKNARPTGKVVAVPEELDFKRALSRTVIFTSTVIFDTQRIAKKWFMMPDIESEDTATWWRVLRKGAKAHGLNEVLTIYRRPGNSLSSNKLRAVKRIWGLYRDKGVGDLSVPEALIKLIGWAFFAVKRRL